MSPAAVKKTVEKTLENAVSATREQAAKIDDLKKTVTETVVTNTNSTVTKIFESAKATQARLNFFPGFFATQRRIMLASIGAVSLATESLANLNERCVARGEEVETQAREYTLQKFAEAKALIPNIKLGRSETEAESTEDAKPEAQAADTATVEVVVDKLEKVVEEIEVKTVETPVKTEVKVEKTKSKKKK